MTSAKIVTAILVVVLIAAGPASQPSPGAQLPLPPSAEAAKEQYLHSLEKAKAEMDALMDKARQQFQAKEAHLKASYGEKLDQAIVAETKKGNLDGALALRAEKAAVEGGTPAENAAGAAPPPGVTKPGLIMFWDGNDTAGKPFPFARVADRIPVPMNKGSRALPLKVPDGTPAIFQGYIRIQRDKENLLLNAKADAYTQIRIIIDDELVLDIDNRSDSRELPLQRGLHRVSIRFSGQATAAYQLFTKRNGAVFTDYVYDPNDLNARQVVK